MPGMRELVLRPLLTQAGLVELPLLPLTASCRFGGMSDFNLSSQVRQVG